ncbi:hypothetical protein Tco_1442037, partial [Tanacetum coccineum]
MYAVVFGVDVPTNHSQPIESTQGTHRKTRAPSSPNPDVDEGDSSAQRKYTIIRLRLPPRRSTRLTLPTPILTATEVYKITLRYTIQLSIAEQKSHDELEAKKNVEKVEEHLIAKEIEKMVEGTENVENDEVDNSISNIQNDPGTRIDLGSYKEIPEVEKTADVQPVNAIEEEEESTEDDFELRRMEKGKHVEETRNTPIPTPIRSPRIHSTLISSDIEKIQELTINDPPRSSSTPSSSSSILSATQRLLSLQKFNVLAQHLQEIIEESLPKMIDDHVKEITKTQVPIYVVEGLIMERQQNQVDVAKMIADAIQQERENLWAGISSQINNAITNHIPSQVDSLVRNYMSGHTLHVHPTQASQASTQEQQYQLYLTMKDNPQITFAIRPRDQDDPYDNAHSERENSAKRLKTSEHGTYVFGESSSGQVNESEPGPSTSELVEEMSQTIDEAKLRKVIDEMLRQQCTLGDEHQYHIDQMQNFLKN